METQLFDKDTLISHEKSKSHQQIFQEIHDEFRTKTDSTIQVVQEAKLISSDNTINHYQLELNDLKYKFDRLQLETIREQEERKYLDSIKKDIQIAQEAKNRSMIGIDEDGNRVAQRPPHEIKTRPDDFAKTGIYYKYISQKLF